MENCVELSDWLKETKTTMVDFGIAVGRAQSIISRLAARRHRPDPSTAVKIVIATRGKVTLDDLYQTPKRYRCDCAKKN